MDTTPPDPGPGVLIRLPSCDVRRVGMNLRAGYGPHLSAARRLAAESAAAVARSRRRSTA